MNRPITSNEIELHKINNKTPTNESSGHDISEMNYIEYLKYQ